VRLYFPVVHCYADSQPGNVAVDADGSCRLVHYNFGMMGSALLTYCSTPSQIPTCKSLCR
jgi:hypothetical protein